MEFAGTIPSEREILSHLHPNLHLIPLLPRPAIILNPLPPSNKLILILILIHIPTTPHNCREVVPDWERGQEWVEGREKSNRLRA